MREIIEKISRKLNRLIWGGAHFYVTPEYYRQHPDLRFRRNVHIMMSREEERKFRIVGRYLVLRRRLR